MELLILVRWLRGPTQLPDGSIQAKYMQLTNTIYDCKYVVVGEADEVSGGRGDDVAS